MRFMGIKGHIIAWAMFKEEQERFDKLLGESGSLPAARYDIIIERHYDKRSVKQNRYQRFLYKTISDHTKQTPDEVKIAMQRMFLTNDKWETALKLADTKIQLDKLLIGNRQKIADKFMELSDHKFPWTYRGTSELNTKEANKFSEDIRRFASTFHGLNIEEPNERS